jgi:hypothetical protein
MFAERDTIDRGQDMPNNTVELQLAALLHDANHLLWRAANSCKWHTQDAGDAQRVLAESERLLATLPKPSTRVSDDGCMVVHYYEPDAKG